MIEDSNEDDLINKASDSLKKLEELSTTREIYVDVTTDLTDILDIINKVFPDSTKSEVLQALEEMDICKVIYYMPGEGIFLAILKEDGEDPEHNLTMGFSQDREGISLWLQEVTDKPYDIHNDHFKKLEKDGEDQNKSNKQNFVRRIS